MISKSVLTMKPSLQLIAIPIILLVCEFTACHSRDNLVENGFFSTNGTKHLQRKTLSINPSVIHEQILFKGANGNGTFYRCPLLTYTPGGRLLIVSEARYNGSDAGLKQIAARRSTDGKGLKWGEEVILRNDSTDGKEHNLGAVLVDDITKEIYIFYTLCAHISACNGSAAASVMYMKSVDDGLTWKPPVNVTAQVGRRDFAAGPGYGIQKRLAPFKGRLIVCGHGGMLSVDGVSCLLSDDHGVTWRWGAQVLPLPAYTADLKSGDFIPDECQPTELPDGSVMLNVRNQGHYHCYCRMVMMSSDGMETIDMTSIYFDTALEDPAVSASILTHQGVMYFSNPASQHLRVNMTLKWSFDNGTTWPGHLSIWKLGSGYSCLTAYPADQEKDMQKYLFLAYEKGTISSDANISLAIISLDGTP